MGIQCEINLHKPLDGLYKPGSIVSGVIKYNVDKETNFNNIIVSLKGKGHSYISHKIGNDVVGFYKVNETYVDVDNIVCDKEVTQSNDSFEIQFSFQLPLNIPPSFKYSKYKEDYDVSCKIIYYIRIKFDRSGFMNGTKRYKKELDVVSGITPVLSTEPIIHGGQKILKQLFSSKPNIMNVKAGIENSVLQPGGKIRLNYELTNDTNVTITAVKCKLIEAHKFPLKLDSKEKAKHLRIVKGTSSKTGSVKSGDTQNMDVEIDIPSEAVSLSYSKLVSREYYVEIKAKLSLLYRDMVLKIPVQIGDILEDKVVTDIANDRELPPSYWEVMGEDKEDFD